MAHARRRPQTRAQEDGIPQSPRPSWLHAAFGLRIRSAFALPELRRLTEDGEPADVTIERGPVAPDLPGSVEAQPGVLVAGDQLLMEAPAGLYRVSGGRSVVVDPRPGAAEQDIRLYLLGTVLGAILHQRALLPLHAAVVRLPGGAAAIAGPSGAGKSTLAAQLQSRGMTILADDLCPVRFDADGAPWVSPGLARIKLWGDSVALVGAEPDGLPRIATGVDKFSLAAPGGGEGDPARLLALYVLRPGDRPGVRIEALAGAEAVSAALSALYRWPIAVAMGAAAARLDDCGALARRIPIRALTFPLPRGHALEIVEALEREWGPDPALGAAPLSSQPQ